jgi:GT2 family glycosyltransferase
VAPSIPSDVGCVVIGRNEGPRLERCLRSLAGRVACVVYVDSGSSDGSIELARRLGARVVELDLTRPFTAARARNAGFDALTSLRPGLAYVQFVDGDCEVVVGFLEAARARLVERPDLAVVCGRRRERHPQASVYNRLCDLEWDTPVGDALACGGDAMMRISAFEQAGGFDPGIIAGEEPELCLRLRLLGWRIERIAHEMTLHDADMHRFEQWWQRAVRSGHSYAEGAAMHGHDPERHWVRETRRIVFWGALVPSLSLGLLVPSFGTSLGLLLGYPVSAARVYKYHRTRGRARRDAAVGAVFTTIGKFPELQGVLRFHGNRLRGTRSGIIEYKNAG